MVLIEDNSTVLNIGDSIPPFSLPATDGTIVSTANIIEPVLVVIFTCNHCPYAQAYEDRLIALAEKFGTEGAAFVLINSNDALQYPDDSMEAMKQKHDEKQFPFPYCMDESQDVAHNFGALCTPHCFLFDADRRLQYKGRIDDNWKEPEQVKEKNLEDAIAAVLNRETPKVSEVHAIGCSIKWKQQTL